MERRQLADGEISVSAIGLGTSTWGATTDEDDAARQLAQFLAAGGNLIDTADVYGRGRAEQIVGRLFRRVVPRSSVVLATKAGAAPPGRIDASRRHLLDALDASLRHLGTDYVDLWQVHGWDFDTPLDETLEAIQLALTSGRARQVGVCNYCGWQLAKANERRLRSGAPPLTSCQVEYSLLERGIERELLPAALDAGIGVLAWGPLGRSVLTGKYIDGVPAEKAASKFFKWYVGPRLEARRTPAIVENVKQVAGELGASPAAVSLAWVRDRPGVSATLVGARTAEQLRASLAAVDLRLPDEARRRLDEISAPFAGYPERGVT